MNKLILFIAFAFVSFSTTVSANNALTYPTVDHESTILLKRITLTAGTSIYLETNERLNTNQATIGKMMKFKVKMNVTVDGRVVIKTGATALGRIKDLRAATFNNPAEVVIELISVQAVDGQLIDLNGDEQTIQGTYPNQGTMINTGTAITANVMNDTEIKV